jgi:hypothetical protein
MLSKTAIGVAAAASLTLGAFFAPVSAFAAAEGQGLILVNYGHCGEEPDAPDCRTYDMPGQPAPQGSNQQSAPKVRLHAHSHQAPTGTTKG